MNRLSKCLATLSILLSLVSSIGVAGEIVVSIQDSEKEFREFNARIQEIIQRRDASMRERSLTLVPDQEIRETSPVYLRLKSDWSETYQSTYPNGDIYFLVGHLEDNLTEAEYRRYYSISKWLVKRGFRAIINPVAFIPDAREAAQNPSTAGIIWSSHGSTDGAIYDSNKKVLPSDVFQKDTGRRLRHFVFSNCYGDVTRQRYRFPKQARVHFWSGTTSSEDLFSYLNSEQWDRDLADDLGIQIQKKSGQDI